MVPPHAPLSAAPAHRSLQMMRLRIGGPLKRLQRNGGGAPQQQAGDAGTCGASGAPDASNGSNRGAPDGQAAARPPRPPVAASGEPPSAWAALERLRQLASQLAPREGSGREEEGDARLVSIGGHEWEASGAGGAGEVLIECSSDFDAALHPVAMRLRRVRLLGLEGAGKTSLFGALLGDAEHASGAGGSGGGGVLPDMDYQEGVAAGVGYIDAAGVNLQDLHGEALQLRRELAPGGGAAMHAWTSSSSSTTSRTRSRACGPRSPPPPPRCRFPRASAPACGGSSHPSSRRRAATPRRLPLAMWQVRWKHLVQQAMLGRALRRRPAPRPPRSPSS